MVRSQGGLPGGSDVSAEIGVIASAQPGKQGRWKKGGRVFQVEGIVYI